IAKICRVSEGTVDRALHDRGGIKKATKEKILKVAKDLNYQTNQLASGLAKGKTMTLGVVCINLKNNFFAVLMQEIESYAKEHGYYISLLLTHNEDKKELEGIRYLQSRQVDGVIIFPCGTGEDYVREMKQFQIPMVTIYNRIAPDFVHVNIDGFAIMKEAVKRILEKGYQRIIYVDSGSQRVAQRGVNIDSLQQRRLGYLAGIDEQSKFFPEAANSYIMEEFDEEEILSLADPNRKYKSALLCPYDNLAIRALNVLQKAKIKIPEDIGIMGFDNIDLLKVITPRLCSVDCDSKLLAKIAVDRLLQIIEGKEVAMETMIGYSMTDGETL
ncbi:MAG: LacI family DNA-binding transcriptional regulator, partial [Vallitaleaceae bacterium]|nr:LacI family DNA-binding transcriptional regulator [Vallitaleaceae bacterium]